MATEIVYTCDLCKKTNIFWENFNLRLTGSGVDMKMDLCRSCFNKLQKFLKDNKQ